jgi:putative membrane protein
MAVGSAAKVRHANETAVPVPQRPVGPPSGRQVSWPFLLGLLLLCALWLGPLPEMSRRAFSPHMILHLGVVVVAAPLIAFGAIRGGLTVRFILRRPAPAALVASLFEMLVVWGWHAPALHETAAQYKEVFIAQQLSFFSAGVAVWAVAFSCTSRAACGLGALAMFFTFAHMAMLGVLLALAPQLLYSPLLCLGAFGLDPLTDQQFGGAMMAIGGGLPYLAVGLFLVHRLLDNRAGGEGQSRV